METENKPDYYIGIGASAGGLEAIEAFFKNVTSGSRLAFIVIQHLSPDYKSYMVELLSKKTHLPVCRAEDGMQVAADTVYLIPPKKNLTIFHGKLLLTDQDAFRGLNLPIDIFLRSLAEDQARNAIAVILSGTGSDGMRGIRAVKENGGMVMVQDEESAKFDGMPRSAISTGLVDFILPPDQMPEQILSFIKHPYVSRSTRSDTLLTDEDGMARIFSLLREKHKVDFTFYKPSTVVRRIERRITVNQIHELRQYVKYLETVPSEITALYRELLIGVTSFFRDPAVFAAIETEWLPQLMTQKPGSQIRLWTAGCSTGEEAYTLAILSQECMERLGRRFDIKIFATDIDRDALVRAGSGEFPESIAADLSPRLLSKYFYRNTDNFQITRSIREMVVFARHNIVKDPPFTNIDLISCRNLLIYLQPVLQKKALELFNFSLNPQGILILGTSETTGDMVDFFDPLNHKFKIYRSKGIRKYPHAPDPTITMPPRPSLPSPEQTISPRTRPLDEDRMLDRLLQALSRDFIPLVVLVNKGMEVIYVAGNTQGFFNLPEGKMDNDITRMAVDTLSIPLSTGIHKAFSTGRDVRYTNIRLPHAGTNRKTKLHVRLLPFHKGQEPLAAVLLEPEPADNTEPVSDTHTFDVGKETAQLITDLEQELQHTRENLQASIEELETSNEELQATNEELLASNEELQSTNEELQSVNEELYTVNAEYQNKIIELTELNNDMDNLLTSTEIGTLFLDEDLEIRKYTPKVGEIYKIRESDIGRPISHLNHRLTHTDPMAVFESVHQSGTPRESEVMTTNGNWFLMRTLPYKIGPEAFSGIVVTFIDISRVKQTQNALNQLESRYMELYENLSIGFAYNEILSDDAGNPVDFRFLEVNPAFESLIGRARSEILGRSATEIFPGIRQSASDWIGILGQVAVTGKPVRFDACMESLDRWLSVSAYGPSKNRFAALFEDISDKIIRNKAWQRVEWLMGKPPHNRSRQPLLANSSGVSLIQTIGKDLLTDMMSDILELLETCVVIREKTGDESLSLYGTPWCRMLGSCPSQSDGPESCGSQAISVVMDTGEPADLPCHGGIYVHAVPIRCRGEVIGTLSCGYGELPQNPQEIAGIAGKSGQDLPQLTLASQTYHPRPPAVITYAKKRMARLARIIEELLKEHKP